MPHYRMSLALSKMCVCSMHGVLTLWVCLCSDRLYANVDELYDANPEEEDPYSYGNESIYDSICYYQAPVSGHRYLCSALVCTYDSTLCSLTASEDH